jgi:uncharacterized membrane protein
MLIAFLAAVGAGTILITAADTANSYARLPDRVPLHFDFSGTVDGDGPRVMVWMLVTVQIAIAALFAYIVALFVRQGLPAKASVAMAGFGDVMLLLFWRVQRLIIETALSGRTRAELRPFWWFFAATMLSAIGLVAIVSH